MIIIQRFPSVAALSGWLNNARVRRGQHDFAEWLADYTRNRELTVNDKHYQYADCIQLVNNLRRA